MSVEEMYGEMILDYYRHPQNKGHLSRFDIHFKDNNPLCGDEIEIEIKLEGTEIKEAKFDGQGCAISQASVSMLLESIIGKNLNEVNKMEKEDILNLLKIEISPVRLKCALLGLMVLKAGIHEYLNGRRV